MSPDDSLHLAVEAFRAGGVLLYPTTTLWGLGGDARQPAVLRRIAALKGRGLTVPFLVLAAGPGALDGLVVLDARARRLMQALWPAPLTLLLPAGPDAPEMLIGPQGWVGVRQAEHPASVALLAETGGWLVSTSANRHGEPAPSALSAVDPAIVRGVDAVLTIPPEPAGEPSTILALPADLPPVLVRSGACPMHRIDAVLSA